MINLLLQNNTISSPFNFRYLIILSTHEQMRKIHYIQSCNMILQTFRHCEKSSNDLDSAKLDSSQVYINDLCVIEKLNLQS